MNPITREEFVLRTAGIDYYRADRWHYYAAAGRIVERLAPDSVLEIGPYLVGLVPGADTMDMLSGLAPAFHRNAGDVPWPIESGRYDLLVALQVWEHLDGRQQQAFQEARRVARNVLLSFPYLWDCPADPVHHAIDDERIREWTCGVEPAERIVVQEPGGERGLRRLICLW